MLFTHASAPFLGPGFAADAGALIWSRDLFIEDPGASPLFEDVFVCSTFRAEAADADPERLLGVFESILCRN